MISNLTLISALAAAAALCVLSLTACPKPRDNEVTPKPNQEEPESPPELELGKAANPLIKGDAPDVSVIRVEDAYYMVSTTMYFSPVAPIMKSYDLVQWQIVNYCADILEDEPSFRLETEDANRIGEYGRGQWAASLRYQSKRYYVTFTNNTTQKTYIFYTTDIEKEGSWQRIELDRQFHDPSLFFDDDGTPYLFSGCGTVQLTQMTRNLRSVADGGVDTAVIPASNVGGAQNAEGSQVYKRNGKYYVFLIGWVGGRRSELCYRADTITGPYEGRVVLNAALGNRSGGVAQGSIIDTPDGDWYGFFFQDRDAIGRMPVLVSMIWDNEGWPVFGGANGRIPEEFDIKLAKDFKTNLYVSDEFEETKLPLAWQWNHNPDNANWSLTERPGYLRIKTGRTSKTVYHARNTLTQRTFEPACTGTIALEPTAMKDGDIAGLIALQAASGFVGIEQTGGQKFIVMYTGSGNGTAAAVTRQEQIPFTGEKAYFKVAFQFRTPASNAETATFSYSLDGETWQSIGNAVTIQWSMPHFTGYRFGLFNYATREAGGYVDFDYFHVE
ncbi:MAG: glycoside hydrolase 43 family protein [Treponema sp.]|jgi:beta-xylosidase|nr:glycoside hydrolase 43 family protein [Treponema sp.]